MRWGLCVALIWSMVQPVFAAPVTVNTGEHDRFTRVVVSLPQDADWQFGRVENGYALRLPIADGYNTSGFFDLIPRDRVLDIAQDIQFGELLFVVECVCNAQASEFQSNFLIIDFSDGAPNPGSPFELALPYLGNMLDPPKVLAAPGNTSVPNIGRLFPIITSNDAFVGVQATNNTQLPTVVGLPLARLPDALATDANDSLAVTLEISESLARGLSEGLLNGDLQPSDSTPEVEPRSNDGPSRDFPGIAARTSIDPLAIPLSDPGEQTQTGGSCLPDRFFELANWDKGGGLLTQLQLARMKLVDDAGNVDVSAVFELARLYVAFGFGKEAQQVLAFDHASSQERLYLTALAQLIEGYDVVPELFASQVSCPSGVALWALLAAGTAPLDAKVDDTAIITAFKNLPPHLQPMIAARLSNQLLRIGSNEAAFQILGTLSSDRVSSVDIALADAALTDALGDKDAAFEQLKDAARNGPRSSPQALLRFFDEGIERETSFMDADFLLADAMRFENADSPIADELADAQFAAYLSIDRFEEARDLLNSFNIKRSTVDITLATDLLLSEATANLEDGDFLRFMWSQRGLDASAEVQDAISDRFLSLGFPQKAAGFLTGSMPAVDDAGLKTPSVQSWQGAAITDPDLLKVARQLDEEKLSGAEPLEAMTSSLVPPDMELPLQEPTLAVSRALLESAGRYREAIAEFLEQDSPDF